MGLNLNLKSFFSSGADAVIGTISNVVDKFVQTPDEKAKILSDAQKEINRHFEVMANQAAESEKAYLADVASSRDANVKIQESDKASWLAKNVAYVFDLMMIIAFIAMLFMVFRHNVPEENKEIFYTGFGLLGSYVGQIMGFHRGSSKGSEDKGKQLGKALENSTK